MEEQASKPRALDLTFYHTPAGHEPVRDWLRDMDRADRLLIGKDLQRVQFQFPVGMPLCRPMGSGLWEVRTNLEQGRTARTLFIMDEGELVALHGFIKKSRSTPTTELDLARKRQAEVIAWRRTHTTDRH